MKNHRIKDIVKEKYGSIATESSSCCTPSASRCGKTISTEKISQRIGYSQNDMHSVPEGANLGLGCGNPLAFASLKEGDTVVDLGSGAGFDCFLAAQRVGDKGRVIGVDMTPEMVAKAQANALKGNYTNVEFRLGEIENLPIIDNSVDVIISNCVINLSPAKQQVFAETFRALKPGGRLLVSDIVLLKKLPEFIKESVEAYVGCVAGASLKEEYIQTIKAAGYQNIEIQEETRFPTEGIMQDPMVQSFLERAQISQDQIENIAASVVSVKISATKPAARP